MKVISCLSVLIGLVFTAAAVDSIAFTGTYRVATGKGDASTLYQGKNPVPLDFKLYSAETGGDFLWARRISVSVVNDAFTVSISDDSGAGYPLSGKPEDMPRYNALADAISSVRSGDGTDQRPLFLEYGSPTSKRHPKRVRIACQPYAVRSSVAATVDNAEVSSVKAGRIEISGDASVTSVTTGRLVIPEGGIRFIPDGSPTLINDSTASTGASFSIGNGGIQGYAQVSELPDPAVTECGRIVWSDLVDVTGATRRSWYSLFYSTGDSTALPEGVHSIYNWSLGNSEEGR